MLRDLATNLNTLKDTGGKGLVMLCGSGGNLSQDIWG